MDYRAGDLESAFGGQFMSFRQLGRGGEGAVFEVWERDRQRNVALKLTVDTGEPSLPERFEQEYKILATTRSPRLVRVFHRGRVQVRMSDGELYAHYWYTMEKCQSSVRHSFPKMGLSDRLDLVMQMLDGLALLHAKTIAHRDIKPENLFLTREMGRVQVKIGDFGIATVTRTAPALVDGVIIGSPAYLAPERWTRLGDDDWRPADQYAAGVTLFEILSLGDMPLDFAGGYARGHERSALRPLIIPEIQGRRSGVKVPEVDKVIAQMLAKRPEWRIPSLGECKRELGAALAMEGIAA